MVFVFLTQFHFDNQMRFYRVELLVFYGIIFFVVFCWHSIFAYFTHKYSASFTVNFIISKYSHSNSHSFKGDGNHSHWFCRTFYVFQIIIGISIKGEVKQQISLHSGSSIIVCIKNPQQKFHEFFSTVLCKCRKDFLVF